MDRDELARDYNKKKEKEGRDKQDREKQHEALEEIADSIAGMSDKRFAKFFQNQLEELKDPKLQKVAIKECHKKLKEIIEVGKMAGYERVRQLYQSRAKYNLTEQEFRDMLYGDKPAPKFGEKKQKIVFSISNWNVSKIANNTYYKTFVFTDGQNKLLELYLKEDINTQLDQKRAIESLKEIKANYDLQEQRFNNYAKGIQL